MNRAEGVVFQEGIRVPVHGFLGILLTKVVEPTNNEAKRQLRELVIYRKICLFIQSETGRRFIETLFSGIATKKYSVIATKK